MNLLILITLLTGTLVPWQNAETNEINRYPMRARFNAHEERISLHGEWDFKFNDGPWRKMPVPGMWELNGCGDPVYVNVGYPWKGRFKNNPGTVPTENNHTGIYRRKVAVPAEWKGQDIFISIGSATSCIFVNINGRPVGYSEDSKLAATFDITGYVKPGKENLIEFEMHRWCDGTYMEDQDFWALSGIARETYLYARPKARIEDVRIQAGADGKYSIAAKSTKGVKSLLYYIDDRQVPASGSISNPRLWTAETPNLYHLRIEALDSRGRKLDTAELDFGFRTVEIKGKQLLVNGKPVLIKGVDRHEISSTGGYVVSEEEMLEDIRIMKSLNINAIRTCHYPNDPRWLELCDRYGFYVVDEANNESHGMGYKENTLAKNPLYAQTHLERVQRMVQRDINHPCIIVWSLGNEAGDGPNFEACYKWLKAEDKTRPVQYEQAKNGYSDIFCPMYANYKRSEDYAINGSKPFIQCEYAHAMGNSMGGFKEYWDLVRKYPGYQGGFIWDFADQALKWPSKKSATGFIYAFGGDFNKYDPSDNSFCCNGIIAADRSLHPHAYEVKYQYQNIWTRPIDPARGKIEVYNEYFFKSLEGCTLEWNVKKDGKTLLSGKFEGLNADPGCTREVDLGYDLSDAEGELFLNVNYVLDAQESYAQLPFGKPCTCKSEDKVKAGEFSVDFDPTTGALCSYKFDGKELLAAPLMPCFGRSVTENDLGAKLQKKMACWLYPEFKLLEFSRNDNSAKAVYRVGDFATVALRYDIRPDGVVKVTESMYDIKPGTPDLFRFGMETAMPGSFSELRFYGPGPWETYADRKSAATVDVYSQKVSEQYHYGYVRPQESGLHTDLRWFELKDPDGAGLRITAGGNHFSASALPFPRRATDLSVSGGGRRDQRHSLELKPDGLTHINIDLVQMGLGCVNSWSAKPRPEYMIPAREREFEFYILPV